MLIKHDMSHQNATKNRSTHGINYISKEFQKSQGNDSTTSYYYFLIFFVQIHNTRVPLFSSTIKFFFFYVIINQRNIKLSTFL